MPAPIDESHTQLSPYAEEARSRGTVRPSSVATVVVGGGGFPREELVRRIKNRLTKSLRRRWWMLVGCVIVAAAAATAGATLLVRKAYEVETTLLYVPLPIPDDGKGLYTAPDLKTLASLVNSQKVLEKVREEFQVKGPAKVLDRALSSTVPGGTKSLKLTFKWDSGPNAAAMLNRLTDVFIEHVAELRREKLAEHINDYQRSLADAQARLDQAAKALGDFHRREHLSDFQNDLNAYRQQISELEGSLAVHARNQSEHHVRLKQLEERLEQVKHQEMQEAAAEKQYQAAEESVSESRRRQDHLRELIDEERKASEIRIRIEAKKRQHDWTERLVAKGISSAAALKAIESDIDAMRTQITDTEKITQWKAELQKIDKVVVPDGAKKRVGSPIMQQLLLGKLEMELQIIGTGEQIKLIEQSISQRRTEIERLNTLQSEYNVMARKVETINLERQGIEALIAGMRNLQNIRSAEFVVAGRAEAPEFPTSSNKKVLLIGLGGGSLLLSLGLVAALSLFADGWSTAARAYQLGLAPLAWIAPFGRPEQRKQLRSLAQRIRQCLPQPGTVIVFSTLSDENGADPVFRDLATLFALREERVVVLDARLLPYEPPAAPLVDDDDPPAPAVGPRPDLSALFQPVSDLPAPQPATSQPPPGLADYLAFQAGELDEFCHPGEQIGVDVIPVGLTDVPSDALATHRMADLIAELRQRYTLVMLLAPSLAHSVDIQVLAAEADAVIAVVDAPVPVPREARRTLAELRDLGAPVLGQIVLDAEG